MTMLVETPEVRRIVNDYDVIFESGMVMPLSIDSVLGDTIKFSENLISIHLSSKPSLSNPTLMLPTEDTTIFLRHVASIQHRVREVVELTDEQKSALHKTWQELTTHPTVQ